MQCVDIEKKLRNFPPHDSSRYVRRFSRPSLKMAVKFTKCKTQKQSKQSGNERSESVLMPALPQIAPYKYFLVDHNS